MCVARFSGGDVVAEKKNKGFRKGDDHTKEMPCLYCHEFIVIVRKGKSKRRR